MLKTNGTSSSFKLIEKMNNSQGMTDLILNEIRKQDAGLLFKDFEDEKYYKEYNIAGTDYLVKDPLKDFNWKITRESKEIAGYTVQKATGKFNDTIPVTAWFTKKLPLRDGPDRVQGLPGLVLETETYMGNNKVTMTATQVAIKEEVLEVAKPTKGKEVTEEEFQLEMKAIQERMKKMYEGGVDTE